MSTIASPDAMRVIDRTSQCIRLLMKEGLSFEALQLPITSLTARQQLKSFWLDLMLEPSPSQRRARDIMGEGEGFFGVREIDGNVYSFKAKDLGDLEQVPFSEELLWDKKNTHILVAVPDCTINEMGNRLKMRGDPAALPYFRSSEFWKSDHTNSCPGKAQWHLIAKKVIPSVDQEKMLSRGEKIASARAVIWAKFLCDRLGSDSTADSEGCCIGENNEMLVLEHSKTYGVNLGSLRSMLPKKGALGTFVEIKANI